jgi:hypothetical protein
VAVFLVENREFLYGQLFGLISEQAIGHVSQVSVFCIAGSRFMRGVQVGRDQKFAQLPASTKPFPMHGFCHLCNVWQFLAPDPAKF